jgi:hypothetical protein
MDIRTAADYVDVAHIFRGNGPCSDTGLDHREGGEREKRRAASMTDWGSVWRHRGPGTGDLSMHIHAYPGSIAGTPSWARRDGQLWYVLQRRKQKANGG